MMKRFIYIFAVALALLACQKTENLPTSYKLSELRFDFSINFPSETKGVKSGWENGDKVYVFFAGVSTGYLTLTYNGTSWDSAISGTPATVNELPSSGTLTAVYLPYATDAPAFSESKWSFSSGSDSYYLKTEKVSYTVISVGGTPTLGAALDMDTPSGYVQLFVPKAGASGTVRLACNAVIPAGLDNIASDGTVVETSSGTQGAWITGYTDTLEGEEGYYVSGKLADNPGLHYYFVMEYTSGSLSYKSYYKLRSTAMATKGAYQLPDFDGSWLAYSDYVKIADIYWQTADTGAAHPWISGTSAAYSDPVASNDRVPGDDDWNALIDGVNWVQMSIAGFSGYLAVDKNDASKTLFFPSSTYWSASKTGENHHSFLLSGDTPSISNVAITNACLRAVINTRNSGFVNPENGGEL